MKREKLSQYDFIVCQRAKNSLQNCESVLIYLKYNYINIMKSIKLFQGSHDHEKSWNLKMHFRGLEKSWISGKMAEVMESHGILFFWSKDFLLFENWKNSSSHGVKYAPPPKKRLGFRHF